MMKAVVTAGGISHAVKLSPPINQHSTDCVL